MQFLVIGHDGHDPQAPARRQAARPGHLVSGDRMVAEGTLWYAAALTGDDGAMIGSMYLVDFPDRDALDAWLEVEPYVVGDVWRTVEVRPCAVRAPWQFGRPEEFFTERAGG